MALALWMDLERSSRRRQAKQNLPLFHSQTGEFSLAEYPEGYVQLRGNHAQKHDVMPYHVPFFCMHLAFSRMREVMSKDHGLLSEVETLVWI